MMTLAPKKPKIATVAARLEHLASMIGGNVAGTANPATVNTLRELYDSDDMVGARFVENLLHCAVCTAQWRCDLCQYQQATRRGMR